MPVAVGARLRGVHHVLQAAEARAVAEDGLAHAQHLLVSRRLQQPNAAVAGAISRKVAGVERVDDARGGAGVGRRGLAAA